MRVETIAGQQFATGLTWAEAASRSYASEVRHELGEAAKSSIVYFVGRQTASAYVVGFSTYTGKIKKPVYSYAATLAAHGSDGVFIADSGDGEWWFVVIHGGMVVPGTDRFDKPEVVRKIAADFASSLNLTLYAGDGVALPTSSKAFGWADAISGAKPVRMTRLSRGINPVPIIVIAAVLVVAWGAWAFVIHPAPKQTPEQQREAARKAYVASVKSALATFPESNDWVAKAYETAKIFPESLAGWDLDDVACQPGVCSATYKVPKTTDPRAIDPFRRQFGTASVAVSQNGTSLKVRRAFITPMFQVTPTSINGLPPARIEIHDWTGLLPLHVADGHITGTPEVQNLAQTHGGAAVGFSPLFEDQVALSGTGYLDPSQLKTVMAWGLHGAFRATSVEWHSGLSANGGWRIGLMRIHGG